uniref:Uncharacterized protein n=1 Tax=Parascaris univalens TaxID=6257 RepID=A0A914ZFG9_PARUN
MQITPYSINFKHIQSQYIIDSKASIKTLFRLIRRRNECKAMIAAISHQSISTLMHASTIAPH